MLGKSTNESIHAGVFVALDGYLRNQGTRRPRFSSVLLTTECPLTDIATMLCQVPYLMSQKPCSFEGSNAFGQPNDWPFWVHAAKGSRNGPIDYHCAQIPRG